MKKISILFLLITSMTFGQTYTIDNTFNPTDTGIYSQYVGKFGSLLNNGKILTVEGIGWLNADIYRLNSDGSVDNSFSKLKIPYTIDRFFANPIQGNFITVIRNTDSSPENITLKRYDANGVEISSFTSPIFTKSNDYGAINKISFLSDGKILIFGKFNFVNGVSYNNIVKLNADGSVDTGFAIGTGFSGPTTSFAIQSDGKYIIGGAFASFNGVSKGKIVRLNSNGTLDTSFNVNTAYNSFGISQGYGGANYIPINDIVIQPNGKILTSGCDLYSNGSIYRRGIVRLNSNGSVDSTFDLNYFTNYYIRNIYYNPDGSIFFKVETFIKKCDNSGTIISTFKDNNEQGDADFISEGAMSLVNNKLLVVGNYKNAVGITRLGYHRLNSNGTLDLTFNPSFGPNVRYFGTDTNTVPSSISSCILPDNKILLYGEFTSYNDIPVKRIIRLTENGEIDSSFNISSAVSTGMYYSSGFYSVRTKKKYDGNIYIKGEFVINGNEKTIIKINHDGSIDSNFNFNQTINDFLITDNNQIILANNSAITRYDSNGIIDNSFIAPNYYKPYSLELLDNNKILVSTGSNSYNNSYLFRLNENGTRDVTFQNYVGDDAVFKTTTLNSGKAYIYGVFNFNKITLSRYNTDDWTLDQTFPLIPTSNYAVLSDERTITDGPNSGTYRINDSNGKQLSTFSLGTESGSPDLYLQNCENIIFYGGFTKINNINKNNIVRFKVQGSTITSTPTGEIIQSLSQGKTLSDLIVDGQNIKWYDSQSLCASNTSNRKTNQAETSLPTTTLLTNETTYYASQTINGFESNFRLPVTVKLSSLGINELELKNLKLYPSPVKDKLTILNSSNIEKVEIYNLLGQKIFENNYITNEIKIDFTNYKQGIYLLKTFSEGKVQTNKIAKE
jgi:uncharacterized delta-60 repeat protein